MLPICTGVLELPIVRTGPATNFLPLFWPVRRGNQNRSDRWSETRHQGDRFYPIDLRRCVEKADRRERWGYGLSGCCVVVYEVSRLRRASSPPPLLSRNATFRFGEQRPVSANRGALLYYSDPPPGGIETVHDGRPGGSKGPLRDVDQVSSPG